MSLQSIIDTESAKGGYTGKVNPIREGTFSGMIEGYDSPVITISVVRSSRDLESMFRAIFRHEINHTHYGELQGCPRTFDNHVAILNSVSDVLANAGYPNVPVSSSHTLYGYMANLFSDFVNNSQLGRTTNHLGMWQLYNWDLDQKQISPLFDAFIRLQEYTFGSKYSKKLLRPHHTKDPNVTQAVRTFIAESGMTRNQIDVLINSEDSTELARIFTEKLLPLIDKNKLSSPEYVSETFIPLEAKLFPSELDNEETKMGLVWRAYNKPVKDVSDEDSQDEDSQDEDPFVFSPPKFLNPKECLKLLYKRLARNLELKVNASTQSSEMPILSTGRRPFNPETDLIEKARVSFDGRLRLEYGKIPLTIPVSYQSRPSSLPEIQFALLDTSSSTRFNLGAKSNPKILNPWAPEELQWSDDSIYHYELLAWFGLLEYLRKQGALRQASVRLANFSSSTKYANNLSSAYDLALSPQFGNTFLTEPAALFGSPFPKKLVFTLSDGQIMNWASIKDSFISNAKRHFYFHLQVGSRNQLTQDLQSNNIPVFFDDGRNLGKMIIDLTRPFVSRSSK